ncbi:bifunctional demethylmenaquinone methyltransferase/2-methoxy-6-polyprenyl-1,4-benzoquinol methylase UbiE [Rickettsiales bacterium LUAb2]
MNEDKVSFGFKKVFKNEKYKLVKDVFDSVAPVYDRMNDLMSFGVHRVWKDNFTDQIIKNNPKNLLDVGGGTGDIAFRCLAKKPSLDAYVTDINYKMLQEGLKKSYDLGLFNKVDFITSNAEKLPFKNDSFDAYSISFCIRNVTDIPKALSEAHRVLKKSGKFYCLEFSHVDNAVLSKAYDLWSFKVIPQIGNLVAKNKAAYTYLSESIRKFPKVEEFKKMIEQAGFKSVTYNTLSFGIAAIHIATKV